MKPGFLFFFLSFTASAQTYLGQPVPGTQAEIFSVPTISSTLFERDFAISPDGTEVYYSLVFGASAARIVSRKFTGGTWSEPKILTISIGPNDIEPALSPDGTKFFFASNRAGNYDIYMSEKLANGTWSEPVSAGSNVNTEGNEFYPSVMEDGTLCYTARYTSGAVGGEDIWCSKWDGTRYLPPTALPPAINSEKDEYNAFVDPKGLYVLFGSYGRTDDSGRGDIYISRKNRDGVWQPATRFSGNINSTQLDYCPYVSPDGKYLFFTSERSVPLLRATNPFKPAEILKGLSTPQGGSNIFWVRFN